jgi:hypothetical protein
MGPAIALLLRLRFNCARIKFTKIGTAIPACLGAAVIGKLEVAWL